MAPFISYSKLTRFQKLDHWMTRSHESNETSFMGFTKDSLRYVKTGSDFVLMSLNGYLQYLQTHYTIPIELDKLVTDIPHQDNKQVYLLVDVSQVRKHTMENPDWLKISLAAVRSDSPPTPIAARMCSLRRNACESSWWTKTIRA